MNDNEPIPHPRELDGVPFLLLFWLNDDKDKGLSYIVGQAVWDGSELSIHLGEGRPPISVNAGSIRKLPAPMLEISEGAEYFVGIGANSSPHDADPENEDYLPAGLKWPNSE